MQKGETEYSIRNKINEESLFCVERGFYSDKREVFYRKEALISKKYPLGIFTGLTAFYIYGLTDYIPEYFYLATVQHSFPIRKKDIKQSYQDSSFFEVGVITMKTEDSEIRIYDLERLLIELFRLKEKYPKEIYYEVIASFRNIRNKIDFYKVNQYLKFFSNGSSLALKIKEAI